MRSLAVALTLVGTLSGCVTAGYEFLEYRKPDASYRVTPLAFSQSGDHVGACIVQVHTHVFERDGRVAICGFLRKHEEHPCSSIALAGGEITEIWFEEARLSLMDDGIANAGFLRHVSEKGKAACVITQKPWQFGYGSARPVFRGGFVWRQN